MSDAVRQRSAVLRDFSGGLNNFWDASVIADNEVPFLKNLEFTPRGALTNRPPIWVDEASTLPEDNVHFDILGFYVKENGDRYAVYTSPTKTYIYDLNSTWTQIWNQKAADFVQYQGYIIMCRTNGAGAYWGPSGAPVWNGSNWVLQVVGGVTTMTATIATMPAAAGLELHQERLFAFGPRGTATQSVMYWSNITGEIDGQPGKDWRWWETATSFSSVNSGDGQWITGLVAGYNSVTVFRNDSTYEYTFTALPELGTMSKVQEGIGAENQRCIVRYENALIVLSADQVYSYYNGVFSSLNDQKVRFENGINPSTIDVAYSLSILGARLIVFYSGNIYVLQLKTGTWSTWTTLTGFAYARTVPSPANTIDKALEAWVVSNGASDGDGSIFRICDHPHDNDGGEEFSCLLRTKIYDFGTPNEWKRLYWWGAEVAVNSQVIARAFPISLDSALETDWDTLEGTNWDQMFEAPAGWDYPNPLLYNVATTLNAQYGLSPQRLNLKLDHSLRFRRIYFELEFNTDGLFQTAPAQIFSITPMIGTKAQISERVS